MNPFSDTFGFLMRGGWPTYVFWLLLVGSAFVAVYNLKLDPGQRTIRNVWTCLARILLGCMWWQQTLWKLPPFYTDRPGVEDSGLRHWMGEMVYNAAFSFQGKLVEDIILPNFYLFAPMVYAIEVVVGVSLILGLLTRFGAILGGLMAVNLWLGLYLAPYEWPWTYFFLILLQFTFGILQTGRVLGTDAILARRLNLQSEQKKGIAKIVNLMT